VRQDFLAERHAQIADVNIPRAGDQAHLTLRLAAKRAFPRRSFHVSDYLRALSEHLLYCGGDRSRDALDLGQFLQAGCPDVLHAAKLREQRPAPGGARTMLGRVSSRKGKMRPMKRRMRCPRSSGKRAKKWLWSAAGGASVPSPVTTLLARYSANECAASCRSSSQVKSTARASRKTR